MTDKHSSVYAVRNTVAKAIGYGNYFAIAGQTFGPIAPPTDSNEMATLAAAGVASVSTPSAGHELPAGVAFARIGDALRQSSGELQRDLDKARRESRVFFNLTCMFSVLGFLLVSISAGLLLWDRSTEGTVGAIASVLSEMLAVLFYKKDRELRTVLDAYHGHIKDYHRLLTMIDITETLDSPRQRDRLKQQILIQSMGSPVTGEEPDKA